MPTTDKPARTHPVVYQAWEESERGWGVRPDGGSLHLNSADREAFVAAEYAKRGDEVPDTYSRTAGSGKIIDVDAATYAKIKKSKNGIWTPKNL